LALFPSSTNDIKLLHYLPSFPSSPYKRDICLLLARCPQLHRLAHGQADCFPTRVRHSMITRMVRGGYISGKQPVLHYRHQQARSRIIQTTRRT
jgi:hypothetical protein